MPGSSAAARPPDEQPRRHDQDAIDEAIRELNRDVPPLSDETREKLAAVLGGTASRRVSLAEAATYSGMSRITLRRWIAEGRLPATRLGQKRIEVDLDDIDRLRTPVPTGRLADAAEAGQ